MSKNILNIDYRETLNTVDSYEEYLSSIDITLDAQLWKKSSSVDNKRAYQEYLNKYPKGHYCNEAQSKVNEFNAVEEREEEAKAWSKALNKNTKASYEKYLMNYYNGLHKNEATRKVDEFIQLEEELEEQRVRDIELAKEKEAWELAVQKNTKKDYENYLEFYPGGIYSCEAQQEIKEKVVQEKFNPIIEWAIQNNIDDSDIPRDIEKLQNLTTLDLSFKEFKELPDSIGNLKNLTHLFLRNNRLTRLPDSMRNLKNLTHLYSESNELIVLPYWIENLRKLEVLYVADNSISVLPNSLSKLKHLEYINIDDNNIKKLPNDLDVNSISVSRNKISFVNILKYKYKYGLFGFVCHMT